MTLALVRPMPRPPRVTPNRELIGSPYVREQREADWQRMQREGRCPSTFEGRLHWLARAKDAEPVPEEMHGEGLYFGPPDREGCPDRGRLSAAYSEPADLVGGSVLGSPRVLDPFRRYIEESDCRTDQDGYFVLPLHAALFRLAVGGAHDRGKPLMARRLFTLLLLRTPVVREDGSPVWFDWARLADVEHKPVEDMVILVSTGIAMLWEKYRPEGRRA